MCRGIRLMLDIACREVMMLWRAWQHRFEDVPRGGLRLTQQADETRATIEAVIFCSGKLFFMKAGAPYNSNWSECHLFFLVFGKCWTFFSCPRSWGFVIRVRF